MTYVELLVAAPETAEEAVTATLDASGALGGWTDGNGVFHGYFGATVDAPVTRFRESWRRMCGSPCPHPIEARSVPHVDWNARWRASVAPVLAAPGLWIAPPGDPPHAAEDTDVVVTIEPGLGFGTGTHPTTQALLRWLTLSRPATVLDVGTGSGILALAAIALGGRAAVGFDIEVEAIAGAAANRDRNANGDRVSLVRGTIDAVAPSARFDAVLANLDAGIFADALEAIAGHCRVGGRLGAAGLLDRDRDTFVAAASRAGLELEDERWDPDASTDDRWWSGWFRT